MERVIEGQVVKDQIIKNDSEFARKIDSNTVNPQVPSSSSVGGGL
jgi:hypothetical protein